MGILFRQLLPELMLGSSGEKLETNFRLGLSLVSLSVARPCRELLEQ